MVRTKPDDDCDVKLLSDVEQHGWHLVRIGDDEDGPAYVFPAGIFHTLGKPEICIFGLRDTGAMGQILNGIVELMKSREDVEDWYASEDVLEGYSCVFREVSPSKYQEYFGYARWFYEGDQFSMLQCVWPDQSGHFPWSSEFNSQMLESQPVLATKSTWPFADAKNTADNHHEPCHRRRLSDLGRVT
jgi:hypothetical protein